MANQKFLPVLYKFLSVPNLNVEACKCISQIVHKRMEKPKKLELVKFLRCALSVQSLRELVCGSRNSGYSKSFRL